jgi:hypothetical protein
MPDDTTPPAARPRPETPPHPYAVPPEDRAEAARRGIALFPFGRFQYVPISGRYPTGHALAGKYVIPFDKLREAERKASARLAEERRTRQSPGEMVGLQRILDTLAAEMDRRADAGDA